MEDLASHFGKLYCKNYFIGNKYKQLKLYPSWLIPAVTGAINDKKVRGGGIILQVRGGGIISEIRGGVLYWR